MKLALILLLSTLNGIYLQTVAAGIDTFSLQQQATLENIACQYPLEGGDAVYSARVMLGVGFHCQSNNRMGPAMEGNNEKEEMTTPEWSMSKLYPNPNNGSMQLDYRLDISQTGQLHLFDISGKMIRSYQLLPSQNSLSINESELDNGIYLYRITVDNEPVISDKLVIIK